VPVDTLRQQELWQLKQEQTKKEAPPVQSVLPETSVTVGPGKALVTAETKQLPQDIQSMYTGVSGFGTEACEEGGCSQAWPSPTYFKLKLFFRI
jgi:hypothetical protein